jgi:hypothetical protein
MDSKQEPDVVREDKVASSDDLERGDVGARLTPEPVGDVFDDLESLRLPQDFVASANVRTVLASIPVRKPGKQEFVRVRPGSEWRVDAHCLTDDETREKYLVTPEFAGFLPEFAKATRLFLAMSRNSPVPFFWPCRIPGHDTYANRWYESAITAALLAEEHWVRVTADLAAGAYIANVAMAELDPPRWPEDLDISELMRLAFRDRLINSNDHIFLQRLRGEA